MSHKYTPQEDYLSGYQQAIRTNGIRPVNFWCLGHWWQLGWRHGHRDIECAGRVAAQLPKT